MSSYHQAIDDLIIYGKPSSSFENYKFVGHFMDHSKGLIQITVTKKDAIIIKQWFPTKDVRNQLMTQITFSEQDKILSTGTL